METNPFQIAAWQAAIVGAILAFVNLGLGILRQYQEDKRKRAETAYKLIDEMFTDEGVVELLYALDASSQPAQRRSPNSERLAADFKSYFGPDTPNVPAEDVSDLLSRVDDLIFHLDRMEHAIQSGITDFSCVEMPIGYYVRALAECPGGLLLYIISVGYTRVPDFLDRYESWKRKFRKS